MEPISLLIKPASGNCNMRCDYCFYANEMKNREVCSYGMMSLETLESVIKKSLAYADKSCTIAFQGGEPTLVGLAYYERMVELVEKYNINQCEIHYALQTNGYQLDQKWITFFKEHNFLLGVSLDGYEELHNQYRKNAKGEGTYEKIMENIKQLEEAKVDFNILTVVHKCTAQNASKIYNFFKRNGFSYQQYIECLDPIEVKPGGEEYSLTPEDYSLFLRKLFDKWYRDVMSGNYVSVRYFDNLLMMLQGRQPESCNMIGKCGKQWVIEADGSVYPCDFYVLDEWRLGSLVEDDMEQIEQKRKELKFIQMSYAVPKECKGCKWYGLCRNGCRRHCEPLGDQRNINYFCKAYKEFFEYAYPKLVEIYQGLR